MELLNLVPQHNNLKHLKIRVGVDLCCYSEFNRSAKFISTTSVPQVLSLRERE